MKSLFLLLASLASVSLIYHNSFAHPHPRQKPISTHPHSSKIERTLVPIAIVSTHPLLFHHTHLTRHHHGGENTLVERLVELDQGVFPPFAITFYKPTYILPFYHTTSPYNAIYHHKTPENEALNHTELKYQFSLMVPAWGRLLGSDISLFAAYTQLSYWQAYNKRAFFRSTDYEPELFLSKPLHYTLYKQLELSIVNLGVEHQSNGFGDELERSWNRLYLSAMLSTDHWLLIIKPWIVFHDTTYRRQNPDMAHYLGHEQIVLSYQYTPGQMLSLETRNLIERMGKRAAFTLSWSFPLTPFLKGYVQLFHGYGQSLLEYNHRTTSFGAGISLNDFV